MADKTISELVSAEQITALDMVVLEQNGTAKKLTGQVLLNWLTAAADGHGGIQSIAKISTDVLADTYRITLADTTVFDFVVTNGRGIVSLQKTGTAGLVDTYTFIYNDGTTAAFTVANGAKGDKGDNATIWVKYASQKPTASSHSFGDNPDAWIGIASGHLAEAPTDWQQYTWYQWKGDKGDTGAAATLISAAVEYQVSDSGTVIPSGAWSASVPVVAQGKYLWTRITQTFNTGSPVISYSVSRMGIDGSGSVSSVANISPDADGNIPLTASDVGALPNNGGDLTGELRMNGQPIKGLNAPTENDQAANMGFVNQQMKKAAPRNLLDNSDFLNPVNQRGFSSTNADGVYTIDRWETNLAPNAATVSIDSSGLTIAKNNAEYGGIYQNFEHYTDMYGKTYTAAICVNGIWECTPFAMGKAAGGYKFPVSGLELYSVESLQVLFRNYSDTPITIQKVAIYEGEYTAETLPEYQPKGYAVELLTCQRYCYKIPQNVLLRVSETTSSTVSAQILLAVPLRDDIASVESGSFEITTLDATTKTGFEFAVEPKGTRLRIKGTKTSHGLTDGVIKMATDVILSADL